MKKQLSIVFPVYNNEETLLSQLKKITSEVSTCTSSYELVIIDDASSDKSPVILKQYAETHPNVLVSFHETNEGTAKTYKELYAKANGDIVVLFSVDGEWNPHDIVRLVQNVGTFDIVIGERQQKAYRLGRKIVSFLFNRIGPCVFGVPTYDAGSIKAIKRDVLSAVPVYSKSVFDEAERIIRAQYLGYRIGAIPISHISSKKLKRFFPKRDLVMQALGDFLRMVWTCKVCGQAGQRNNAINN
jgi:glycosyltransferase involved in cell wall biosynthesis